MRYHVPDESGVFGTRVSQVPGNRCGQKPKLPERMFFEALLYVARTGRPGGIFPPSSVAGWR
ncbi:MAG: hypothetical protein U0798_15790 [Gemmataceae bacterium]